MKVFIVCSGLGNVRRGFESFAEECFDALHGNPQFEVALFGGGKSGIDGARTVWNLPRNRRLARIVGRAVGRDSYTVEQHSFGLSLTPYLSLQKPDVIYFSDGALGNFLWHWRNITGLRFKLLFSNGGPLSPPFSRWDHVQQLTPSQINLAYAAGEPADKHTMLPYGLKLSGALTTPNTEEKKQLRQRLGIPADGNLILSVGALNRSHKRMDYLIDEVARSESHSHLLLLGERDTESSAILRLGAERLGPERLTVRTVPHEEIDSYYKAADLFALASLSEGFGRVYIEAMSNGLPTVAHDCETNRFVLGSEGIFSDLEQTGSLASILRSHLPDQSSGAQRERRHRSVYERFSWERLRPDYIELIQRSCSESVCRE